ncbi:MAG TPA: gamma-glutamylcyclotransferase family protein [Gemmataceae bacterium]
MPIFLYGTLLPALVRGPIAAAVARLRPLGPATVPGRLYDLGPYPALVSDPAGALRVAGELFQLPADAADLLAELDEYEGTQYRRVATTAALPDGRSAACWVYEYAGDVTGATAIVCGDYRRWVGRTGSDRPDRR